MSEHKVSGSCLVILNKVFYLLDEYAIDPVLHGSGDITDGQLIEGVRDTVAQLKALEQNRRRW